MAGVHWGQQVAGKPQGIALMLISNAVTLVGWFVYLVAPALFVLSATAVLFLVLLAVDWSLYQRTCVDQRYFILRASVTVVVVVCLATSAAQLAARG
jgi:Protein of unknown function (DUF3429)